MSEGQRLRLSISFGIFLYRCTNDSEEPAALSVRHSITDLHRSHVRKSERNTYVVKYVYIYNSV